MRPLLIFLAVALLSVWVDAGVRTVAKKEATLPVPDWHIPVWVDETLNVLIAPFYLAAAVVVGAWVWVGQFTRKDEVNNG